MIFEAQIDNDSFRVEDVTTYEAMQMFAVWQAARLEKPLPELPEMLPAVELRFTPFKLVNEEGSFMLLLRVTQKCGLALDPVDAHGNPATVDGVPSWTSSDDTVVTVEPETDGMRAVVKGAGKPGSAQVNVRADARSGPEVVELIGVLDVEVKAGEAVSLGIKTGTPEEQ